MTLDPVEQRADLSRAPAFVPLGKTRAEVQTKNPHLTSSRNDLEKRMPRGLRVVPLVIIHFLSTEKTNRMITSSSPDRKLRRFGDAFDHGRVGGLLKNDEIGRSGDDRFRQRLFPTV